MFTPTNENCQRTEIISLHSNKFYNNNEDLHCQICSEKLCTSKTVHSNCGHDFHYLCLINRLTEGEKLLGKKLNFNFIKCSICDLVIECPSIPNIQKKIDKNKQLYLKVSQMIEQRIIYQKKDPKKASLLLFLICNKCGKPYYAGENNGNNNNNSNEENQQDCLCGKDSFAYDAKGSTFCKIHGFDYIEYKCKFCCKIASRFCSQKHFCEECYANKNYENNCEIKKCDRNICEFSGIHAPNGEEYCLGCFICRYENVKNEYPTFNDE
jgi:E3 ubiquitin-protein ligase MYCBP2